VISCRLNSVRTRLLQINNQTSLLPADIHNERIFKTSALPKTNTLRQSIPSDVCPSSPVGEIMEGVYMPPPKKKHKYFEDSSVLWAKFRNMIRTSGSSQEGGGEDTLKTPHLIWHYFFVTMLNSTTRWKKYKNIL
jgi:hypothetical protein